MFAATRLIRAAQPAVRHSKNRSLLGAARSVGSLTCWVVVAVSSSGVARVTSALNMPAMSPTMTEGTVTEWKVNVGDSFTAGDVLCQVGRSTSSGLTKPDPD